MVNHLYQSIEYLIQTTQSIQYIKTKIAESFDCDDIVNYHDYLGACLLIDKNTIKLAKSLSFK